MKKNLLSLFSGCGGMDIGFEGGFKIPKATINQGDLRFPIKNVELSAFRAVTWDTM